MISKVVCQNCGKGVQHANTVSHAKNRTHITRKPNLHFVKVLLLGKMVRQRLCAKCIRSAVRPHKLALLAAAKAIVAASSPVKK